MRRSAASTVSTRQPRSTACPTSRSNAGAVAEEARRQLAFLAMALRNIVNGLNPQVIVLGGFLATLQAIDPAFLEGLLLGQALGPALEGLEVRRSELGPELMVVGAAELAFEPLLSDPAALSPAGGFLPALRSS